MRVAPLLALCFLFGCEHAIPASTGHLQSLSTGKSVTFNVTFTDDGGHIWGVLPGGERFKGDYQANRGGGSIRSHETGDTYSIRENSGNGSGSLVGDRGTVLDCPQLTITHGTNSGYSGGGLAGLGDMDGHPARGFGNCVDQQGQRYLIRF